MESGTTKMKIEQTIETVEPEIIEAEVLTDEMISYDIAITVWRPYHKVNGKWDFIPNEIVQLSINDIKKICDNLGITKKSQKTEAYAKLIKYFNDTYSKNIEGIIQDTWWMMKKYINENFSKGDNI